MSDTIRWTRAEAMACAYCWCEFSKPEDRADTPETYWLKVAERTRQECRHIARQRYLVSVALRQAAPVFPPDSLSNVQDIALSEALGIKARHRRYQILQAIYRMFLPKAINSQQEMDAALEESAP